MKIFTLNSWMLPFGLARDHKIRFNRLINFIKNEEPDVVALQEIWFSKYVKNLKKLNYYIFSQSKGIFNRSGLVIMTKKKHKCKFIMFPKYKNAMSDYIIKRGFQIIEIEDLRIFNAHLYVKPGVENIKYAKKELELIKKHMRGKSILCGDLNIEKKEFDKLNNNFFKYAEDTKNTFSWDNKYVKKWWDPKMIANKKIDYILVKNPARIKFKSRIIKKQMSDHEGILSEVKWKL
ncbi:endonuclease/exonuclease/phosphatase family protein [archaeon]|jgi:endonuclease/exonuclease/phosphatase family metal-dependent hydrolase|nr:endonuclease/exonuclease/phosphatase family protein [archaeon]MBT6773529.1 endonuclease/exonuclease/phosphatase family protein [archaeon]MBT7440883.1 endonuclease/exonuclease/phosphatase family protein [archaeon]